MHVSIRSLQDICPSCKNPERVQENCKRTTKKCIQLTKRHQPSIATQRNLTKTYKIHQQNVEQLQESNKNDTINAKTYKRACNSSFFPTNLPQSHQQVKTTTKKPTKTDRSKNTKSRKAFKNCIGRSPPIVRTSKETLAGAGRKGGRGGSGQSKKKQPAEGERPCAWYMYICMHPYNKVTIQSKNIQ